MVACLAIFVIGPPLGYMDSDTYSLTPQAIAVILTASGSVGCLMTCCWIPRFTRRMSNKAPAVKSLKRMNLLGLVRFVASHRIALHCIVHHAHEDQRLSLECRACRSGCLACLVVFH